MKKNILIFVSFMFIFPAFAETDRYNIRFTLERDEEEPPIVYYFSHPNTIQSYPILVLCDGSTSKGQINSVFFIRDCLEKRVQPLQVGYLTIEKWGVDGNQIDEKEFWNHYTRSQRLTDHLKVIKHLESQPPLGWNGKLIFIGASEGGPLVTDLTILCPNTLATINWAGAGDWSWADEFWWFFEHWKNNSIWIKLYDAIPRHFPFSCDIPSSRQEFDVLVQQIIANPTPDLWVGGLTYLYHADAFQKTPVDYSRIRTPFLVVEGTEDSTIESCDQFVQKALAAEAPITYFRIEGMDHYIRKRPEIIDLSFEWLKEHLTATQMACQDNKEAFDYDIPISF